MRDQCACLLQTAESLAGPLEEPLHLHLKDTWLLHKAILLLHHTAVVWCARRHDAFTMKSQTGEVHPNRSDPSPGSSRQVFTSRWIVFAIEGVA